MNFLKLRDFCGDFGYDFDALFGKRRRILKTGIFCVQNFFVLGYLQFWRGMLVYENVENDKQNGLVVEKEMIKKVRRRGTEVADFMRHRTEV